MCFSNLRSEKPCHGKATTVGWAPQTGEHLVPDRSGTAMLVLKHLYAKCLRPFVTASVQETKQQTNTSTGLCNTSGWRRQKNERNNARSYGCAYPLALVLISWITAHIWHFTNCHYLLGKTSRLFFTIAIHDSNKRCVSENGYMIYFLNCNWVATRWQQYSTHLHTNSTQNDTKQTKYPEQHKTFLEECGPCPVFASYNTLAFDIDISVNCNWVDTRWQ
jgi:hypothetical protein